MSDERKLHYRAFISEYIPNDVEFFEIIDKTDLSGIEVKNAGAQSALEKT